MNTASALLEPKQNSWDGWCDGMLAGLIVSLCQDVEPEYDPAAPKVFLSIELKYRVVALIDSECVDLTAPAASWSTKRVTGRSGAR